jgi:26S proteasome regulatory subunit N4
MTAELNSYEQMLVKKTEIEQELADLGKILDMENSIGMHGPLIDAEGYPRADIDIYKVRMTRQKINCLQNDYTALLNRIEKELESKHELSRDNNKQISRG